jgi:hypothetical protein
VQESLLRGRGGSQGCDTSRPPYVLGSLLTDGGEVVKLKPRSHIIPRKLRIEVSTAVTMKYDVFWDVTLTRATRRNIPEDTILHIAGRFLVLTADRG